MAEPKPFPRVKFICGLLFRETHVREKAKERLIETFGPADLESPPFAFDCTDYYEREMGPRLTRTFLSFASLVDAEGLAAMKLATNGIEREFAGDSPSSGRTVNLDPGILTASALIMATAKDFSHRIPLREGIYAHLEFLFTRTGLRFLDWTYPDFRKPEYQQFFLEVRRLYFDQIKAVRIP
jgi:hypothetical protein